MLLTYTLFKNKAVKELQQAFEHHSTEILEQKLRNSEIIQALDSEVNKIMSKFINYSPNIHNKQKIYYRYNNKIFL